jgi:glycosyltransferase involved in cell wall biosynthesis
MRVSVIIPCYNAAAYLAQTIGSVLAQSRPADETIVVDDGSFDESLAIARAFGDRVRVVSGRVGGAPAARNRGASLATGDALMFLDADDVLGPAVLERLAVALATRPGAIAVCPWYRLEHVGGRWVRKPRSCAAKRKDQDYLGAWMNGWYHPPCSVLWSRAAYEKTGGWDATVRVNNDGDIMMRALVTGVPIVEAGGAAAYYRRLPADVPTVSGARLTEEGLGSRIEVMDRIARMLEERRQLRTYRGALGDAFERIGEDCRDRAPALYDRCQDLARRYSGPARVRNARRRRRAVGRRLAAARAGLRLRIASLARRRRDEGARGARGALEEIRFGVSEAERALGHARPAVSVIIPTYNRAPLLPRALDSVLAQTYADFEVLVVDDGSSDATAEVLARYSDDRVRVLRHPVNRGVGAARNFGLREARGDFIAFLDSDDEWLPDKLALQLARFRALGEDVGLVYSGMESVSGDGTRSAREPAFAGDVYREMLRRNVIEGGGSNAVIRREVVSRVGFFDEDIPAIEDYEYWLRIARLYRVDYVRDPLIRYYDPRPRRSETADAEARRSRDVASNRSARDRLYDRYGPDMKRMGVAHLFLLDSARRSYWDRGRALRLLLRALWIRPGCRETLGLLATRLVPQRLREALPARGRREQAASAAPRANGVREVEAGPLDGRAEAGSAASPGERADREPAGRRAGGS